MVLFRLAKPREIQQLTRVNEDVLVGRKLGEVEEIWYRSADGTDVQGWLVKPPDFDPQERYPLVLHIHGGPHAMYGVGFNYSFQNLAANGYLVLYTNPRGSTGYGTEFGNAIDDAYPSVDYDDLMAGVDAVLARGFADPNRMYVTGVSGGGVLSSWIIGHTNRFAAAAVRAPVIDWISFAGNTDITAWGYYRFRTPFWEDAGKWLRHSPLMYVQNVRTPTLLMTGELDLRTPMGQTEEYYQALKTLGVPVTMVRFNEEYHGTGSKPSNFMRTQLYLMSWFEKHVRDAAPSGQDLVVVTVPHTIPLPSKKCGKAPHHGICTAVSADRLGSWVGKKYERQGKRRCSLRAGPLLSLRAEPLLSSARPLLSSRSGPPRPESRIPNSPESDEHQNSSTSSASQHSSSTAPRIVDRDHRAPPFSASPTDRCGWADFRSFRPQPVGRPGSG